MREEREHFLWVGLSKVAKVAWLVLSLWSETINPDFDGLL
jgi:hypothetical protein